MSLSSVIIERSSILSICDYDHGMDDHSTEKGVFKTSLQKVEENNLLKLQVDIPDIANRSYIIGNLKARVTPSGAAVDSSTPDKLKNTVRFTLPNGIFLTNISEDAGQNTVSWIFDPKETGEGVFDGVVVNGMLQGHYFESFWKNIEYPLELALQQFKNKFQHKEFEIVDKDGSTKKIKKYEHYTFSVIKPKRQIVFKLQDLQSKSGFQGLSWNDSVIRDFNLIKEGNLICNIKCFWTIIKPDVKEFLIGCTFTLERNFYMPTETFVKKRKSTFEDKKTTKKNVEFKEPLEETQELE